MLKMILLKYEMDESYDDLMITFPNSATTSGGFEEIEGIPKNIKCIVRGEINPLGGYNYIDIVNPQAFMSNSYFDDFVINGYNIKDEIIKYFSNLKNQSEYNLALA